jgi:hypothetical protein
MTEDLVREAFSSREHLVAGAREGLADAVRRRVTRRRRAGWLTAGGLTLATALGVTAAAMTVARPAALPPAAPTATTGSTEPGWRWESSLGAEIEVPAHWAVNDFGCNMTDKPTVVRGYTVGRACLTPEPSTKEVAILQSGPDLDVELSGSAHAITVDGVPASRMETVTYHGRYLGWIAVPSRDVYLFVKTLDPGRTERILDSFRLVDPDRLGCPTHRPPVTPQAAVPGGAFVPPDASSIAACSYYGARDDRLQASVELANEDVAPLVGQLNAAPRHRNPDRTPDTCLETRTPAPDVVLFVRAPSGQVTRVWATFSYCTGRGLDNGSAQAYLTDDVIHLVMRPLHTAYGFPGGPGKPGA